jgi:hypothetical protein
MAMNMIPPPILIGRLRFQIEWVSVNDELGRSIGSRPTIATYNRTAVMIGETPQSSCMMLAKLYCIPYHQKYGTKLTTTKMVTF